MAGSIKLSRIVLALAAASLVMLTVAAAAGVRGSDQFWYVADVESIARGDGAFTNSAFPRPLLSGNAQPPLRPIHNNPLLYLVAALTRLIGDGYSAWLLFNLGCVLGCVFLIRALLDSKIGEPLANLAAALFALLPVSVWQATQPLVDAGIALLVMLAVWSLCSRSATAWAWPLAFACLLLATLSREFFALALVLLPLLHWRWSTGERRRRLFIAGLMLLTAVAVLSAKDQLFPKQVDFSLEAAWRQLGRLGSTMFLYFDLGQEVPRLGEVAAGAGRRLVSALKAHLLPPWRQMVFYWPFDLLVAVTLGAVISRQRKPDTLRRLLWLCAGLLAVHLAAITVQHPSYRYTLAVTAPLLVAAALAFGPRLDATRGVLIWVAASVLCGALAVDLALVAKSRREGLAVRQLTAATRQRLDSIVADGDTVAFEARNLAAGIWYLWAVHALPEATLLFLDPGYRYDQATYDRLRGFSGAAWLISHRDSPLRDSLRAAAEPEARLPEPATSWEIYRLPPPPPP